MNLPIKICINKSNYEIKENYDCPNRSNNEWSVFYFAIPYFYGKFQAIFKIEEKIVESIFYPLLTFMDKYGFWGGKWNIGYGRLKVLEVKENDKLINNWENENFLFSKFSKYGDKSFKCFIKDNISKFNSLTQKENKIQIFISYNSNNSFTAIIEELMKAKVQERAGFNTNTEERHKIFGTTKAPPNGKNLLPQGSKILPYINRTQRGKFPYDCGFLSIAGLLNLEGENNG